MAERDARHDNPPDLPSKDSAAEPRRSKAAELCQDAKLLDLVHDAIFVHDMEGRVTFWNAGAEGMFGWRRTEMVGRVSHEVLGTEFPTPPAELTAELLKTGRWEGELVHTTRRGRRVVVDSRWQLLRDEQGNAAAVLEADRDVTKRKEVEASAGAERDLLFTLLNMFPGYAVLIDREHRIRYANHGFLDAFSDPEGRPCYDVWHGRGVPCEDCPLPVILDSGQADEWEQAFPDGKIYQVWALPFRDVDGEGLLLELGMDITRRRKLELLVGEMSEAQRRRVGKDLHDALGQSLTGVGYLIAGLSERIAEKMPEQREVARQITDAINRAIAQVRGLAQGLDPVGLGEDGLPSALRELAGRVETATGAKCEFRCEGETDLEEFAATHLYRIAQEAVNNAARHARARRIEVSLTGTDETVLLRVADDGVGLSPRHCRSKGMGLQIMRYRSNAIGGKLHIRRGTRGGTVVTCLQPKGRPESE